MCDELFTILFIVGILFGLFIGLSVAETNNDIVRLDMLDKVCQNITGNLEYRYYENNVGRSSDFVCLIPEKEFSIKNRLVVK